jgi:hypothetical protein
VRSLLDAGACLALSHIAIIVGHWAGICQKNWKIEQYLYFSVFCLRIQAALRFSKPAQDDTTDSGYAQGNPAAGKAFLRA